MTKVYCNIFLFYATRKKISIAFTVLTILFSYKEMVLFLKESVYKTGSGIVITYIGMIVLFYLCFYFM